MAQNFYAQGLSIQIFTALLKAHGIKKVSACSGTEGVTFADIARSDSWFEVCTALDERSAGYIACGIAAETAEPVVLSCAGPNVSRSICPALTEAYYRQLPVLAVTSAPAPRGENLLPKFTDRPSLPNDCAKLSVYIPEIRTDEDRQTYTAKINEALLELRHNGGGPVHICIAMDSSENSAHEIPEVRAVRRIEACEKSMPEITAKTVGIFAASHRRWSSRLTDLAEEFCAKYNGVILCGNTGNYRGKYWSNPNLVPEDSRPDMDLMIHIGGSCGKYTPLRAKDVWRVSLDGELQGTFGNLGCVFQMREEEFFSRYIALNPAGSSQPNTEYYSLWKSVESRAHELVPELAFSGAWAAQQTSGRLPGDSVLHLGGSNTLKAWECLGIPEGVSVCANTGTFGIEGCVSALLGASLVAPEKICFGVFDAPAFFCNMNAAGNRHRPRNLRIMVLNSGYVDGELLKHYAQGLGFEYLCASGKEEYLSCLERFTVPEITERPVFFEVFTDSRSEVDALSALNGGRQ